MAELKDTTIYGDLAVNGAITGCVRRAFCTQAAPTDSDIRCVLDVDDSAGEPIVVNCMIAGGGTDLSAATPTLADGDEIMVINIGGTWYCTNLFYV